MTMCEKHGWLDSQPDSKCPWCANESASPISSPAGRIAEKWGCSIEEAETKIVKTAEILQVDRDEAIAFLMAVHPSAIRKPENHGAIC